MGKDVKSSFEMKDVAQHFGELQKIFKTPGVTAKHDGKDLVLTYPNSDGSDSSVIVTVEGFYENSDLKPSDVGLSEKQFEPVSGKTLLEGDTSILDETAAGANDDQGLPTAAKGVDQNQGSWGSSREFDIGGNATPSEKVIWPENATSVLSVNDAPVDDNESVVTNEDTLITGDVLLNTVDVDGGLPVVTSFDFPGSVGGPFAAGSTPQAMLGVGTIVLETNGSYTFTPNLNYNGPVPVITYTISDGNGGFDTSTLTINVTPVNDAPVAVADTKAVQEDVVVIATGNVLTNDIDPDSLDTHSVTLVNNVSSNVGSAVAGSYGSVVIHSDGSYTYNLDNGSTAVQGLAEGQTVTDVFTYENTDNNGATSSSTLTITITGTNDAPVAVDDTYTTNEDTVLTIPAAGVLFNDADVDNDPLSSILVSGPAHGTLSLSADGSFVYTPDANYNGPDSFVYKANDGSLDSNNATVNINVTPVNDAPVAVQNDYTTNEDTAISGNVILGNTGSGLDSDIDTAVGLLTASLVSTVSNGSLVFNADGTFTYTPGANFNGSDSFTYKVNDGSLDSNTVTVNLTVNPVNDAPVYTELCNTGLGPELLKNGSFENNLTVLETLSDSDIKNNNGWLLVDGRPVGGNPSLMMLTSDAGQGWMSRGTVGSQVYGPIELQNSATGGSLAQAGQWKLELDSHNVNGFISGQTTTNASVYQDISGLTAGATYLLEFWYKPRGNGSDSTTDNAQVLWNGNWVTTKMRADSVDATSNGWVKVSLLVEAASGTNTVEFRGSGTADTYGAFIDNVSLKKACSSTDEDHSLIIGQVRDVDSTSFSLTVSGDKSTMLSSGATVSLVAVEGNPYLYNVVYDPTTSAQWQNLKTGQIATDNITFNIYDGAGGVVNCSDTITVAGVTDASYVLFSQTSDTSGARNLWSTDVFASGNKGYGAGSNLDSDVTTNANDSLFNAAFGPLGAEALSKVKGSNSSIYSLQADKVGDLSVATLGGVAPTVDRSDDGDKLSVSLNKADWNKIKNIELRLDNDALMANTSSVGSPSKVINQVDVSNFVDTRIKLGSDSAPTHNRQPDGDYTINVNNSKRGEVDAMHANDDVKVNYSTAVNDSAWINEFEIKTGIYNDVVTIKQGELNVGGGANTIDGSLTTVIASLGDGNDTFDSSQSGLMTTDIVHGGNGDDTIEIGSGVGTAGGGDMVYGDAGNDTIVISDTSFSKVYGGNDTPNSVDSGFNILQVSGNALGLTLNSSSLIKLEGIDVIDLRGNSKADSVSSISASDVFAVSDDNILIVLKDSADSVSEVTSGSGALTLSDGPVAASTFMTSVELAQVGVNSSTIFNHYTGTNSSQMVHLYVEI